MSGKIIASCKSARNSRGIFFTIKSSMLGILKCLSVRNICHLLFHSVSLLSGTGVSTVSITTMTVSRVPVVNMRISTTLLPLVCTLR